MGIRALIVEDEPLARQTLRDFAAEAENLEIIGEAADGATAVRLIDELEPTLVFLDIELPEISGLEVLRRISHRPAIVFTTAYDQHAVTAFELEAFDYLLKPFGKTRFNQMFERVKRKLLRAEKTSDNLSARAERLLGNPAERFLTKFFVRERDLIVPVNVSEIVRLEADDDYTIVYTSCKKHLVNVTLQEFERKLDSQHFRRVHRSHLINLNFIQAIEVSDRRLLLRMKDKSTVLTSRAGAQTLKDLMI